MVDPAPSPSARRSWRTIATGPSSRSRRRPRRRSRTSRRAYTARTCRGADARHAPHGGRGRSTSSAARRDRSAAEAAGGCRPSPVYRHRSGPLETSAGPARRCETARSRHRTVESAPCPTAPSRQSPPPPPPVTPIVTSGRSWWQSWWFITGLSVVLIVGAAALIASTTGGGDDDSRAKTKSRRRTEPTDDPPPTGRADHRADRTTTPDHAAAEHGRRPTTDSDRPRVDRPASTDPARPTRRRPSARRRRAGRTSRRPGVAGPPGETRRHRRGLAAPGAQRRRGRDRPRARREPVQRPAPRRHQVHARRGALGYYGLDDPGNAFIPSISGVAAASVELDEDCGVIPDDFRTSTELFSGGVLSGTICFVTTPADDGTVQLYATTGFDGPTSSSRHRPRRRRPPCRRCAARSRAPPRHPPGSTRSRSARRSTSARVGPSR